MCGGGARTSDVHMTPAADESGADDKRPSTGSGDPADAQAISSSGTDPDADLTPDGRDLAREDLDPGAPIEVAPDEVDAEELLDAVDEVDDTPGEADPEDVEIADAGQLDEATETARQAKSSQPSPVKRNLTVAPVKKAKPTPKQSEAHAAERKRTTPALFVKQSIGELKKVVWPTGDQLWRYFVVVLVFVLFIMFFVAGLDALFGWLLLKVLG